jgi:predicted acylesterase/phospholipase RssA
MSKLGLVFAGGGGKGAYEVGVWKAFKEYGIDKNISAISGTSVGGLNGALFTKGDFEQALKVWEEMNPKKILQINPAKVVSALAKLNLPAAVLSSIAEKLGFLKSEGVFTQNGLEFIIRDSLKDGDLKNKIPFYICATDVSSKLSWKPIYKKLNDLDYENIVKYLSCVHHLEQPFHHHKCKHFL